jgi:ribonucleoside-diphosphate reductase alpha chain
MASIMLAKERTPFPAFSPNKHFERGFCAELPEEIKEQGKKYGLRNVALSAVAPTGSLSIMAQCSSGLEPIFALSYKRFVELGGDRKSFEIFHPGVKRYFSIAGGQDLSDVWMVAHEIGYSFRIKMQGIIQKYIDNSISSTLNLPKETTTEQVGQIYIDAWKNGLKGITVYREGSREGILVTDDFAEQMGVPELDTAVYCIRAEGGDKFYLTISYENKDITKPYQVFVLNYKQAEKDSFVKISNTLIKMLKAEGVDEKRIEKYIERSTNSLTKLTRFISLSMKTNNLDRAVNILEEHAFVGTLASKLCNILRKSLNVGATCKKCKSTNVVMEEGCMHCRDCDWSGCS